MSTRTCHRYRQAAAAADMGSTTPFAHARPTLLTQVLAVNALLITATVLSASVAASLHSDPIIERRRFLVLVAALLATVLVNGSSCAAASRRSSS